MLLWSLLSSYIFARSETNVTDVTKNTYQRRTFFFRVEPFNKRPVVPFFNFSRIIVFLSVRPSSVPSGISIVFVSGKKTRPLRASLNALEHLRRVKSAYYIDLIDRIKTYSDDNDFTYYTINVRSLVVLKSRYLLNAPFSPVDRKQCVRPAAVKNLLIDGRP